MRVFEFIGRNRNKASRTRVGCRGIIVRGGKILLSNEVNVKRMETPGGGMDEGETFEQCCVREVEEETGCIVKPGRYIATVREFLDDMLYINHYFECELIREDGKTGYTESEIRNGMRPEWMPLDEVYDRFSRYEDYRDTDMDTRNLFLREFSAIDEYLYGKKREYSEIDLYGRFDHKTEFEYLRQTARGAVLRGDEILMSHERETDQWLFPGGGLEKGETLEECCAREIEEETGVLVEVERQFALVNEHYGDANYQHAYFLCRSTGEGKIEMTEREISSNTAPEWIRIDRLLEILKRDAEGDEDAENFCIHRREYHALCALLESLKN